MKHLDFQNDLDKMKNSMEAANQVFFGDGDPSILLMRVEGWRYLLSRTPDGVFHLSHPAGKTGYSGKDIRRSFPADYFVSHSAEDLYNTVAGLNLRPDPRSINKAAELDHLEQTLRKYGWIEGKTKFNSEAGFESNAAFPGDLPERPVLFADADRIGLKRIQISSDAGGGWHLVETELVIDPFRHLYTKITDETVVHNSHGTDTDDYHYETVIDEDAAAGLLRTADPVLAAEFESFSLDCKQALEGCRYYIGRLFPECEAEGLIYTSGTSTIVKVKQPNGERNAIKFCIKRKSDFAALEGFLTALKQTGGSQWIVPVESVSQLFETDKDTCIAVMKMPLLEPVYLPQQRSAYGIRFRSFFASGSERAIWYSAAAALSEIHRLGYVYMDLRPENLLSDPQHRVVLGDPDSIRPVREQYAGHLQTSSLYRAPELTNKKPFDSRADIYSWGTCMQQLSCQYCLQDPSARKPLLEPETELKLQSISPDTWAAIVKRASSPSPASRYASGFELVQSLKMEEKNLDQLALWIRSLEGRQHLLYSDPSNPYESIEIAAYIQNGALTITDTETEHAPNDSRSRRTIRFDADNTRKVFQFLSEAGDDPVKQLKGMMTYNHRTRFFLEQCDKRGIRYSAHLSF